jgi:hypothetical protein
MRDAIVWWLSEYRAMSYQERTCMLTALNAHQICLGEPTSSPCTRSDSANITGKPKPAEYTSDLCHPYNIVMPNRLPAVPDLVDLCIASIYPKFAQILLDLGALAFTTRSS